MRKQIRNVVNYLRRAVRSPIGELTRWQRTVRFAWDLTWHCWRALQFDRASEMAAALTYRTIFSLIPLMVMVLLVFQAFGGGLVDVRQDLQRTIFHYLGLTTIRAPVETTDKANGADDKQKQDAPKGDKLLDDADEVSGPVPTPGAGPGGAAPAVDRVAGDLAVARDDAESPHAPAGGGRRGHRRGRCG